MYSHIAVILATPWLPWQVMLVDMFCTTAALFSSILFLSTGEPKRETNKWLHMLNYSLVFGQTKVVLFHLTQPIVWKIKLNLNSASAELGNTRQFS